MGSIFNPPSPPPAPSYSPPKKEKADNTGKKQEEATDSNSKSGLNGNEEDKNRRAMRGRNATVNTSLRGVLKDVNLPKRKTLLGE